MKAKTPKTTRFENRDFDAKWLVTYWIPSGGDDGDIEEFAFFDSKQAALDVAAGVQANGARDVNLWRARWVQFQITGRVVKPPTKAELAKAKTKIKKAAKFDPQIQVIKKARP